MNGIKKIHKVTLKNLQNYGKV